VTIAAGFKFHPGVLLCADTQHTYSGIMKLQESKIKPITFANGGSRAGFVIAGSVAYGHMAVDACVRSIEKIKSKNMTAAGFRLVLEEQLENFYQKHIYPHPHYGRDGGPDFQLLIAFWSHLDKTVSLFSTWDSAVTEVPKSATVGTGSYLAQYLIKQLYKHTKMNLKDVANIAIHVLRLIKEHVDTCGGRSEFFVLNASGDTSVANFDISSTEAISSAFEEMVYRIFLTAADLDAPEAELDKEFQIVKEVIKATVDARRRERARWDGFMRALSGLEQPAQGAQK
jgi:20S proteasome alpha/beta subunit